MIRSSMHAMFAVAAIVVPASSALAQLPSAEHIPSGAIQTSGLANISNGGFGSATTQRFPLVPREDEAVSIYFKVCCQFQYDRVAVYFTTDGSEPQADTNDPSIGLGTTQVLSNTNNAVQFIANDVSNVGFTKDWWRATLPAQARAYGQTVRYKIARWSSSSPSNSARFANGSTTSNSTIGESFVNKLAWPGAGFGEANPSAGYPSVKFWKEEAVAGNGYINVQLDQNGSYYDIYYPGAGGVYGVGTKNEGYVDGLDTFPPGLPVDNRGQMHINQMQPGIRVGNTTYWVSNISGSAYTNVQQRYLTDTQTVYTQSQLNQGGASIRVEQYDFAPKGVSFPTDSSNNPLRGIAIKRMVLTNQGSSPVAVNVYMYADSAINGGDQYDASFVDASRGAMVHFDNVNRTVTNTGSIGPGQEYNPTTSPGYLKDKSIYLATAMKIAPSVGAAGGTRSSDSWRDTSGDQNVGWIGQKVTLAPGVATEVSFITCGGYDNFAGATGTYNFQCAPAIDWFFAQSMLAQQTATNTYWTTWLNNGVTIDTPDDSIDALFNRGLLGTALHIDAPTGSIIAGFHNGAYPYVWPRDAVYAAITLARTGHTGEARGVYDWMKNTAYREFEGWGRKGFWKQKYSTDGYVIWGAPQIDETAVFPWGVWYQYQVTGDSTVLTSYLEQVRDAVLSSSQTSTVDPTRLKTAFGLMYSNNVWEDSYDTFIYSNANVVRGLRDAANVFNALGLSSERDDANNRANSIKSALDARLDWDGENTDISQLGLSYPFEVYAPNDFRAARVIDRINGVRTKFNNAAPTSEPLVNFSGQFTGLINRYWGDNYWNGGPWFLSTLWYGAYYAQRQDFTSGKADIDNHYYRINQAKSFNGPIGFGAEQMSPSNSLLYAGQSDFRLQTAWPNAWESMSTYVDAVMLFLDFRPDAAAGVIKLAPKMPTAWSTMSFRNLPVGNQRVNVSNNENARYSENVFIKSTSGALGFDTTLRIPAGRTPCSVIAGGVRVSPASVDTVLGKVRIVGSLPTAANQVYTVRVNLGSLADIATLGGNIGPDGQLTVDDLIAFLGAFFTNNQALADIATLGGGIGSDGQLTVDDLILFLGEFFAGCP